MSRSSRSATTCDIPHLPVMFHRDQAGQSDLSRLGRRLGRYLTVTVPPWTPTSGILPSNRAR